MKAVITELIFVHGFCMQYLTVFLTKAYIFIDEAWFHMIGCISAQNNRN